MDLKRGLLCAVVILLVMAIAFPAKADEKHGATTTKGSGAVSKGVLDQVGPALGKHFTAQPMNPPMPDHLWMDIGDGQLAFMHFDKPVSDPTARLLFIGEAVKGRFCAEDQPEKGKTGFVHFHRVEKPAGMEHAHGGLTGESGYWLRHIALGEVEMMGKKVGPGIVQMFMPTPPPFCP